MMGTSDDSSQGPQSSMNKKPNRKPIYSRFTQQELHEVKPIMTSKWVIVVLISIGIVFIPIGLLTLSASDNVVEFVYRYDDECMPKNQSYVSYIQNPETKKDCLRNIIIPQRMKKPIFIYYELTNFHQNHRRYMESLSELQLKSKRFEHADDVYMNCDPEASVDNNRSEIIVPCGLVAWSLFNDTYKLSVGSQPLEVSQKDISWFHDPKFKFGSDVYPKNFQNGSLIGGGNLDPSKPLSDQEHLIVWMRPAALPTFRKLYGRLEIDLEADQRIEISIENNYNTYMFGGQKKLVLSTASWLGGKNYFLARGYLTIGGLSLFTGIFFMILYFLKLRIIGDPRALSWNTLSMQFKCHFSHYDFSFDN